MAASLNTVTGTVPDGSSDEMLALSGCSSTNYRLAGVISLAGQYTFSVWAKAAAAMSVEFRVLGNVYTESVTTSWTKLVFTVDASTTTYIDVCPSADTTLYLYKGMLQQGQFDTDWKPAPEDTEAEVQSVSAQLELKIGRDENDQIVSMLNASVDVISLTSNRISITSDYFTLTKDGVITAASGTIGGWTLTDGKIYGGDSTTGTAVMQRPSSSMTYVFAAGGKNHSNYSDCPFRVTKTGAMYAENAYLGDTLRLYSPENGEFVDALTATTAGSMGSVFCPSLIVGDLTVGQDNLSSWGIGSGGEAMFQSLTVSKSATPKATVTDGTQSISLAIGSGSVNRGIYDDVLADWLLYYNDANLISPNPLIVSGHSTPIGSLLTASASNVSLSANTNKNITSISLPAGSWIIGGWAEISNPSATYSVLMSISPTSATGSVLGGTRGYFVSTLGRLSVTRPVTLTATTTYYLVAQSTVAATVSSGYLYAMRVA